MALITAGDVINSALRASGVVGVGQTALPVDISDALDLMNTLLSEWQINRWLVYPLVDVIKTSTAAVSYTVGPGGDFVFSDQRPDKLDAAFARLIATGEDTPLFPFMSREGYDRFPDKSAVGTPLTFFYDPVLGTTGTIYFAPVPNSTWSLHLNAKASLGQLAATTTTIALPRPYVVALLWNLAAALRPYFQMPEDPQVTARAQSSLLMMVNSIAQVPQVVAPITTSRAGIFSSMPPPGSAPRGSQ